MFRTFQVYGLFLLVVIADCNASNEVSDDDILDLNEDGIIDVFYEYEKEFYYELVDRNFDGKIDESWQYDLSDRLQSGRIDSDFNGILETKVFLKNGSYSKVFSDSNGNGIFDIYTHYKAGTAIYSEKYYSKTNEYNKPQIGKIELNFDYPVSTEELTDTNLTEKEFESERL